MTKDSHSLTGGFDTENTGGVLSGFWAEEDEYDRRTLWRLGSWAAASVGAVIVAILANQSSIGMHREQIASSDLARQSQQIQTVAKETQSEARRLASAIETLNSDRDRLYSRITVLEQGLDSVTGAIARQNSPATPPQGATSAAASSAPAAATATAAAASTEAPAAAQKPSPAPTVSPVAATVAATTGKPAAAAVAEPNPAPAPPSAQAAANNPAATSSLMTSKSMMAPPDPAAAKLIETSPPKTIVSAPIPEVVASAPPAQDEELEPDAQAGPKLAVQRTEFGVDVGGANSLPGLRALWRGLLKSKSNAAFLVNLRPVIMIKEGTNGLGVQLRLVAGPITDAAEAARICAAIAQNDRTCTTTLFEGQRLAVNTDDLAHGDVKPATQPSAPKRYFSRRTPKEDPAQKPEPSTLSLIFGTTKN
ncbi:MAG TPA: hypothetical protein VKS24_12490 [Bradyrhizobium sp.]|nr:hypothetical protein [Bradyrhizobium sp.]